MMGQPRGLRFLVVVLNSTSLLFCPGHDCLLIGKSTDPILLTEYYAFYLPQLNPCSPAIQTSGQYHGLMSYSGYLPQRVSQPWGAYPCAATGPTLIVDSNHTAGEQTSDCRLLTECQVHNSVSSDTLSDLWHSLAENHGTMDSATHTAVLSLTGLYSAIGPSQNKSN